MEKLIELTGGRILERDKNGVSRLKICVILKICLKCYSRNGKEKKLSILLRNFTAASEVQ